MEESEGEKVEIQYLRDTGAMQTLLLEGVIPLGEKTATGETDLIQGFECEWIEVPLHKIYFHSDLVSGTLTVAVRPKLPYENVALILGNDVAGSKVFPEYIPCVQ